MVDGLMAGVLCRCCLLNFTRLQEISNSVCFLTFSSSTLIRSNKPVIVDSRLSHGDNSLERIVRSESMLPVRESPSPLPLYCLSRCLALCIKTRRTEVTTIHINFTCLVLTCCVLLFYAASGRFSSKYLPPLSLPFHPAPAAVIMTVVTLMGGDVRQTLPVWLVWRGWGEWKA